MSLYTPNLHLTAAYLAESRVTEWLTGAIIPLVIASIFVVARIYTRGFLTPGWGLDDTLLSIAWFLAIAYTITNCLAVAYGCGRHIELQAMAGAIASIKISIATNSLYYPTLSLTKLAICGFYRRVFLDGSEVRIVYAMMVFITLYTIPITFLSIFRCNPISDAWNFASLNCKSDTLDLPLVYAAGALNIFADILLATSITSTSKIVLLAIVSLSSLVIVATILRMVILSGNKSSLDFSWTAEEIVVWSSLEISIGLFCAATPGIRPLIARLFPKLIDKLSTDNGKGSKQSNTLASVQDIQFYDENQMDASQAPPLDFKTQKGLDLETAPC